MGSLPYFFSSLYLSISSSLYLNLSLHYISLSIYPSLSLVLIQKKNGPQSLIQIGGDRGPIKTVNLAVGEDVTQILGAAVCHAHLYDAYWYLLFVFKPP